MPTATQAPPTWDELKADPRYANLTGGERMQVLDEWHKDVQDHLGDSYDAKAAEPYLAGERAKIAAEGQGRFNTALRAGMVNMGGMFLNTLQGVGNLYQDAGDSIDKLTGSRLGFNLSNQLPAAPFFKLAGPLAKDIAAENERFYAPDTSLNPKSATIGGAVGQAVGMMPVAWTGGVPAVLSQAATQGYAQGSDAADDVGIQNPLGRMAMGAGFGVAETAVERMLPGIGGGPLKEGAASMFNRLAGHGVRTILSEAAEEPITGVIEDTITAGAGKFNEDPNRPGYTLTGKQISSYLPGNLAYWQRRGHESLGGAAGGALFAGAAKLAGGHAEATPPPLPKQKATIEDLDAQYNDVMNEAGATDEDFANNEPNAAPESGQTQGGGGNVVDQPPAEDLHPGVTPTKTQVSPETSNISPEVPPVKEQRLPVSGEVGNLDEPLMEENEPFAGQPPDAAPAIERNRAVLQQAKDRMEGKLPAQPLQPIFKPADEPTTPENPPPPPVETSHETPPPTRDEQARSGEDVAQPGAEVDAPKAQGKLQPTAPPESKPAKESQQSPEHLIPTQKSDADIEQEIQQFIVGHEEQMKAPLAQARDAAKAEQIPDLPSALLHAIVKMVRPDVMKMNVLEKFGKAEADRVPSSGPSATDLDWIAQGKEIAKENGWQWESVIEKARQQEGLDDDFLKPGSHEAIILKSLREAEAARSKQRAMNDAMEERTKRETAEKLQAKQAKLDAEKAALDAENKARLERAKENREHIDDQLDKDIRSILTDAAYDIYKNKRTKKERSLFVAEVMLRSGVRDEGRVRRILESPPFKESQQSPEQSGLGAGAATAPKESLKVPAPAVESAAQASLASHIATLPEASQKKWRPYIPAIHKFFESHDLADLKDVPEMMRKRARTIEEQHNPDIAAATKAEDERVRREDAADVRFDKEMTDPDRRAKEARGAWPRKLFSPTIQPGDNTGTKILDATGKPQLLFHHGQPGITKFELGTGHGNSADRGVDGIYLSPYREAFAGFGRGGTYTVHADIRNPVTYETPVTRRQIEEARRELGVPEIDPKHKSKTFDAWLEELRNGHFRESLQETANEPDFEEPVRAPGSAPGPIEKVDNRPRKAQAREALARLHDLLNWKSQPLDRPLPMSLVTYLDVAHVGRHIMVDSGEGRTGEGPHWRNGGKMSLRDKFELKRKARELLQRWGFDGIDKRGWEPREFYKPRDENRDGGEVVALDPSQVTIIDSAQPGAKEARGLESRKSSSPTIRAIEDHNRAVMQKLGLGDLEPGKRIWGAARIKKALAILAKDTSLDRITRLSAWISSKLPFNNVMLKIEANANLTYAGLYTAMKGGRGEITLNLRALGQLNQEHVGLSLLHEAWHHATLWGYHNPKTATQKAGVREISDVFKAAQRYVKDTGDNPHHPRMTDADEFMAGMATNQEFREWLDKIPDKYSQSIGGRVLSLFDRFIKAVAKIVFGRELRSGSLTERAMLAMYDIVGEEPGGNDAIGSIVKGLASPASPIDDSLRARTAQAQAAAASVDNPDSPSQARDLKPEFGEKSTDYTAWNHEREQARADAVINAIGNLRDLATVLSHPSGFHALGLDAHYKQVAVVYEAIRRAHKMETSAKTDAERIIAQGLKDTFRNNILSELQHESGQGQAAHRAFGEDMRVPLMVDDAVSKAQEATIDPVVPVNETTQAVDAAGKEASAQATDKLVTGLETNQQPTIAANAAQHSDVAAHVAAYFDGKVPKRVKVVNEAESNREGWLENGTLHINAAALKDSSRVDVARVIEHEMGHGLFSDATLRAHFDKLWESLDPMKRGEIANYLAERYSAAERGEEMSVRALDAVRELSQGKTRGAWDAFKARAVMLWSRLTGQMPKDVDLLAARLIEIGVQRLRGNKPANGLSMSLRKDLLRVDSPKLVKLLNQLRDKISGMNWRDVFTSTATNQKQWEIDTYVAMRKHQHLQHLTPEEAKQLTREFSKAWQRERRRVWNSELNKSLAQLKPKVAAKVKSGGERLLKMINLGALDASTFRHAIAREFGLKDMNSAEVADAKRMAERLQLAPEGLPKDIWRHRIMSKLQDITKLTKAELAASVWVNDVLFNARTMLDIGLSGANTLVANTIGAPLTAARTKTLRVWGQSVWQNILGFGVGLHKGLAHIATGERALVNSLNRDARKSMRDNHAYRIGQSAAQLKANTNPFARSLGHLLEAGGRLLSGLDEIGYKAGKEGAMVRSVAGQGKLALNDYLDISPKDRQLATARARQEIADTETNPDSFAGRALVRERADEILRAHLPDEIVRDASEVGEAGVFTNDPTGVGWAVMQGVNAISRLDTSPRTAEELAKMGVWKRNWLRVLEKATGVVAPFGRVLTGTVFIRNAMNSMNEYVSWIPGVGALRFLEEGISGREKKGIRGNPLLSENLAAKQAVGLAASIGLIAWLLNRDDKDEWGIEGGWSGLTNDQRSQLYSAGKKPFSLWHRQKDGSIRNYNFQQWPTSGVLTMAGTVSDYRNYKKGDADGIMGLLAKGTLTGILALKDKAQLQQLAQIFGEDSPFASSDAGEGLARRLNKVAANIGTGFIPKVIKDVDIMAAPDLKEARQWWQVWARETPIVRETLEKSKRDIFGEKIALQRGPLSRITQAADLEPHRVTLSILNERSVFLPTAGEFTVKTNVGGTSRKLTDAERDRYEVLVGQANRDILTRHGSRLLEMKPEQAQKAINDLTKEARAIARQQAVR